MKQVAIIDYGAGNVQSVQFAFERLGVKNLVTADKSKIQQASHVVFPGVGHAKAAKSHLTDTGLINFIKTQEILKNSSDIILMQFFQRYNKTILCGIDESLTLIKKFALRKPIKSKIKISENFKTSSASSLYGFTKLASEKLIKEMFFKTNLKFIIDRFGVISGPWQFGKQDQGFVPLWVAKHYLKKKLKYIGFGGQGHQVRDIIHIDDVCKIILLQIKNIKKINNDTFNIGGGPNNAISLKNLTIKCQKLTKNVIKLKKIIKTSTFDIPYYVSDNAKIKKFYKWKPKKNIDTILKDIYDWLLGNKNVRDYF